MKPLQTIWDYLRLGQEPEAVRFAKVAMGVYWPGLNFSVISPQVTIPEYPEDAEKQGITENAAVSVIVGDFRRMDPYAKEGLSAASGYSGGSLSGILAAC